MRACVAATDNYHQFYSEHLLGEQSEESANGFWSHSIDSVDVSIDSMSYEVSNELGASTSYDVTKYVHGGYGI